MFYQLIIAAFLIIYAVSHANQSTILLGKKAKKLDKEKRHAYQKGLVTPFLGLGTLFIVISFVLHAEILSPFLVFVLFMLLVTPLLIKISAHQKKYLGSYFEW
ncbi:hypothetical protein [Desertibacillus haloalkaliphilus]|uniref:hypothetical protein n=1 Tax=Desertibacillus haloalkaliphilus TaxID=1328930 RepID=UPI001C262DB1|nr:hypothetical protein [Desertibacillus haloalkaliphilus]MBU8906265.1 hypothetical protein [Desertibacillus haloalkaliphilus]